jgi:hypothetical protein
VYHKILPLKKTQLCGTFYDSNKFDFVFRIACQASQAHGSQTNQVRGSEANRNRGSQASQADLHRGSSSFLR